MSPWKVAHALHCCSLVQSQPVDHQFQASSWAPVNIEKQRDRQPTAILIEITISEDKESIRPKPQLTGQLGRRREEERVEGGGAWGRGRKGESR